MNNTTTKETTMNNATMTPRESKTAARMSANIARYAARLQARKAAGEVGQEFEAALTGALTAAQETGEEAFAAQNAHGMLLIGSEGVTTDATIRHGRAPKESFYALLADAANGKAGSYRKTRDAAEKANAAREDAALVSAMVVAEVAAEAPTVAPEACQACQRVARYGTRCRAHSR